jgi:hypothetical protein
LIKFDESVERVVTELFGGRRKEEKQDWTSWDSRETLPLNSGRGASLPKFFCRQAEPMSRHKTTKKNLEGDQKKKLGTLGFDARRSQCWSRVRSLT